MSTRPRKTHGLCGTKEYYAWASMKHRCTNPKNPRWESYGGRGITLCDRWLEFKNFFEDMGAAPEGTSLERKDNSKGYEPSNCCWATAKAQANNRRWPRRRVDNLTGIQGVSWDSNRSKWRVEIKVNQSRVAIGRFDDFFEACAARRSAENKLLNR